VLLDYVDNIRSLKMGATMTITESTEAAVKSSILLEFVERGLNPRYQFTATAELVDLKSRTTVSLRRVRLSLVRLSLPQGSSQAIHQLIEQSPICTTPGREEAAASSFSFYFCALPKPKGGHRVHH
jgi:hypothetical protein